jgi:hypothetical protein
MRRLPWVGPTATGGLEMRLSPGRSECSGGNHSGLIGQHYSGGRAQRIREAVFVQVRTYFPRRES